MTLDESLSQSLREDWRSADLTEPERVMLAWVEKLTLTPARCTAADLDGLRAAGFDDVAILQIAGIAGWFNYINRMADALGVGKGTGDA